MNGLEAAVSPSRRIIISSSREESCVSGTVLIGWEPGMKRCLLLGFSNIFNKVSALTGQTGWLMEQRRGAIEEENVKAWVADNIDLPIPTRRSCSSSTSTTPPRRRSGRGRT